MADTLPQPAPVPRPTPVRRRPVSLAARIAYHEAALVDLRQQQRDQLRAAVADAFPREVFSALQVWQQPALRAACLEAGITTVQQLGTWLRSWCGSGLARIDRDVDGVIWAVSETDLHADPC